MPLESHHRRRGVFAGTVAAPLGRRRPSPSLGAFSFSAAENLLTGAMDASARWRDKEEEQAVMRRRWAGGSAPSRIYSRRKANRQPPTLQAIMAPLHARQLLRNRI